MIKLEGLPKDSRCSMVIVGLTMALIAMWHVTPHYDVCRLTRGSRSFGKEGVCGVWQDSLPKPSIIALYIYAQHAYLCNQQVPVRPPWTGSSADHTASRQACPIFYAKDEQKVLFVISAPQTPCVVAPRPPDFRWGVSSVKPLRCVAGISRNQELGPPYSRDLNHP